MPSCLQASINEELQYHYQQLVNLFRPDLRDETEVGKPPCDPIFHDLELHHFPQDDVVFRLQETQWDHRKVSVVDLLTTQMQDKVTQLPKRLLLLGHPESGKTALFTLLLHYWLHDRSKVTGLSKFDIVLAIDCLSLDFTSSVHEERSTVYFMKDVLAHLPKTVEEYGKDMILRSMKEKKVLVLIDSINCVPKNWLVDEEISLFPWTDQRIIFFSRSNFMLDSPCALWYKQSTDHLVLRLWGGVTTTTCTATPSSCETLSELSGVLSGKLFDDYCKRLCEVKNENYEDFKVHLHDLMKTMPVEMRKPFNIYMTFQAWEVNNSIIAKTESELYAKWFELCSQTYMKKMHRSTSDPISLISHGTTYLSKFTYDAFIMNREYLLGEDYLTEECKDFEEMKLFFTNVLVPHCDALGKIQALTFRTAAHQTFFVAKHISSQIHESLNTEKLMPQKDFHRLRPILPMTLGLTKKPLSDIFTKHIMKLTQLIMQDEVTEYFNDQIINYAVQILGESALYNKNAEKFDDFVNDLLDTIKDNNWCIVDGNLLPQALQTLCEYAHDNDKKPQRLNLNLSGLFSEMPGLSDILTAVQRCDIIIELQMDSSFNGMDDKPLDEVIRALQGQGRASLGKFMGYLKDVRILDSHPATRRISSIGLRIKDNAQYESLCKMSKNSNKLNRVVIRIPNVSTFNVKKMKELPFSVTHLKVYLEGITDEVIGKATAAWRAIRGSTQRKQQEYLCFWYIQDWRMSPSGVIQLIDANLPAAHIVVPLVQPLSDFDERKIQKKLSEVKGINFTVRLLGSVNHPRRDLKPEIKD
ncbi:uncharacterized protein [Panulirus ornatus]|uniref:uncharacterized protein isoform X2 n=1 Tax=Panulirus ornatus TaxID=150431 RepID=UPI003A85C06E